MSAGHDDVELLAWPAERLGEAMEALAIAGGLSPRAVTPPVAPGPLLEDDRALAAWIDQTASHLGVEAEPIHASQAEAIEVVRAAGPALRPPPRRGPPALRRARGAPRAATST